MAVTHVDRQLYNPLRLVAISKQLEWIGRSAYILTWSIATALHSDINQTSGSGGHLNMWENRCMRATVCLLHAGRPTRAGNAAKSGQFIGQLSWVTGDPISLKGLNDSKMFIYDSNTSKEENCVLNSSSHIHITINVFLGNNEANYHKKNNVKRY